MPIRRNRTATRALAKPRTPVVASPARTPPKPTINPNLKPGAPGGPPKSAGQLAFEAKEREDKRLGRGRWAPGGPLAGQNKPVNRSLPPGAPGGPPKSQGQLDFEAKERQQAKNQTGRFSPLAPYLPRAKESIEAADLPGLNEIARSIADQQTRADRATGQIRTDGAREVANLEELFARLNNFTGNIQTTQRANYADLRNKAGATYDQLAAGLNSTFDAGQARSQAEADRIGLGQHTGVGEANAASERDQTYLTQLAGVDKAALQGGFDQQAQGFDQLMDLTRANAGVESASRQAVSRRETGQAIADLQFELQQRLAELNGRAIDIRTTQGARINDLATALEDKMYEREREAAQDAFNNRLAQEQLNLSKSAQQFSQDIARKQQALAELQASIGPEGPSYLEQLQVAKLENEIKADMAASQAAVGQIQGTRIGIQPSYTGNPNSRNPRGIPRNER